jgi:hypothetical protein
MTAVVKGINVLEPALVVNTQSLSGTGVKIQVAKDESDEVQVAVVGFSTFAQPGFVSLNTQALLTGSPLPPLVEACVHVVADAAAPAQSLFAPPSVVVQVAGELLHVPVFAAAHVTDVGDGTNAQLSFVPLALTLQSLGTVVESPNPCQVKLVSSHVSLVVNSGLSHSVQIPCDTHESSVV